MPFPTLTDLAFWNARNEPGWASRIKTHKPLRKDAPNIDHVVNAHAGGRMNPGHLETHNVCAFVAGWLRRGEPVRDRLLELAADPGGTNPRKRASLARKWAARI